MVIVCSKEKGGGGVKNKGRCVAMGSGEWLLFGYGPEMKVTAEPMMIRMGKRMRDMKKDRKQMYDSLVTWRALWV